LGLGSQRRLALLPVAALASLILLPISALAGGTVTTSSFGRTAGGEPVDLYTLSNGPVVAKVTNYGGILVSLVAPDRDGRPGDVILGFDSLDGYLGPHPEFGATVGRYANRIAKGHFSLGGQQYSLARNDGDNHLHGGIRGFSKALWQARESATPLGPAVELRYLSKDGEEGYPGNLQVRLTYTLTATGELRIEYEATTDKETVVNLSNHSYFNLAGAGEVLGHELTIDADRITAVALGLIPTGELRSVQGTPFDFHQPTPIGARIDADDAQIAFGHGYDHNFILNGEPGHLRFAARLREPRSGRVLEVATTEPGLQLYTGNFLDGSVRGKAGVAYGRRSGLCLETQHFPDSPNHPEFPSTSLRPGQHYRSTTVFRLTTDTPRH
jgi:aldose 1-epimerase